MIDSTTGDYNYPTPESEDQLRAFFTTLFHLAENEQINVRPDFPEGCTAKGFNNYFLNSIDEAVVACLHLRELKAHAYVSINPRDREKVEAEEGKGKEGSSGGKSTVSRVITLFSDYDYAKMGQSRDQALEYLRSLPCPPTMIVDSGGGLQVYWLLVDPVTSTEGKALAEKIMSGMCEWWHTDQVKDYSRILRVPGTLNVKPEYETPRECFIEQSDNGARYSLDELEAMIPSEYRSPQYSSSSSAGSGSSAGVRASISTGGDLLATPEVPLGPNSNRHLKGTSVVGHYASHRTSSGRPVSEEWVKRQAEMWFENPNNCSAPLHLSEDPKEIKEWDRLVSDIYKKEKEKIKASENGSGAEGGIVPSSHRPLYMSRDDETSSLSIEATTPTSSGVGAVSLFELPPPGPTQWFVKGIYESGLPAGFYGMSGSLKTYMVICLILCLLDPDTHDWFGYEIPTMKNILFVDYEMKQDVIHRRVLKVLKGMEIVQGREIPLKRLGNLHYYDGKKATSRDESVDEALRFGKDRKCELVVIDSFGFAMGGDQEKQEAVTAFQTKLERFLNEGLELFITDHPPRPVKGENIKDKDPFGSIYKKNWIRGLQQLRRTPESRGTDHAVIIVDTKKVSDGKEEPPFAVRVDFLEDALLIRPKDGAVEEITSGDRIYQAYLDLKRATAREVFEHINTDTTKPATPLSTIKNKTTDLKRVGLLEEVGKDGRAPIYSPPQEEEEESTHTDRPDHRPNVYTEDGGTMGRTLDDGPDGEGEKAEEKRPPSFLNNIIGKPEISEEEYEEQERLSRMPRKNPKRRGV